MRRSEVSALRWADVADAADGDGVLVTVRRSKTHQEGEVRGVRFREGRRRPRDPNAQGRREPGAGGPRRARSRRRWWGCSSRRRRGPPASSSDRPLGKGRAGVGAHEPGGASTTDVMLAGNWKTSRWWRTTRPGRPLNAGLSRGICDGAPGFGPAASPRPSESLGPAAPVRLLERGDSGTTLLVMKILAGSLGLVAGGALLLLASGGPLLLFYWASVALSLLLVHGLWIMTAVAVLVFIVNVVRG